MDEAYYQRFMGMSEAEVTDDLLPVDLMDADPGAVDSLRSKEKVDERGRSLGSSQGFLNNVKKVGPHAQASQLLYTPFRHIISFHISTGATRLARTLSRRVPHPRLVVVAEPVSPPQAMPAFQPLDDPSMGPRVYIIPQNQGEAPLEVRSIAPGQRKARKGVIAEIPGRNLGKRRRLMDIPDKVCGTGTLLPN